MPVLRKSSPLPGAVDTADLRVAAGAAHQHRLQVCIKLKQTPEVHAGALLRRSHRLHPSSAQTLKSGPGNRQRAESRASTEDFMFVSYEWICPQFLQRGFDVPQAKALPTLIQARTFVPTAPSHSPKR